MDFGLDGKRAVVAGASAGLGLGCARALADEGAVVVMGSRTADRINSAAESVPGATAIVGDVSNVDGAVGFINDAADHLGGIDILITNAGGPPVGDFESTDLDAYHSALDLNLMSVVAMCKTAVPMMRDQKWGRVVAITSLSVRQPMAQLILSNTARAGATAFLKTLATEVAGDAITVNSLQPGLHLTDRLRSSRGDNLDDIAAGVPAGVIGRPEDFGRVAAFLCSDAARFITGAAIPVDGGSAAGLQ
ncbi:MAG: SDR family oxidoreductase [Acidimicrobiales bacterium]